MEDKQSLSVSSPQDNKQNVISDGVIFYTSPQLNTPNFYHYNFISELEKIFNQAIYPVEIQNKSVNLLLVLASYLKNHWSWLRSLKGPKIIIEHDAYLNFIWGQPYFGFWEWLYKQTKFDLLICSGKQTAERLSNRGIPTAWVPKGCAKHMLLIENRYTGQIGSFGTSFAQNCEKHVMPNYNRRLQMGNILKEIIPNIFCAVQDFANVVGNYSAVCQNDQSMREPMAKHFECSALGCAVIRDNQQELYDLGYNSKSMIVYNSFDELLEIVHYYCNNPDKLIPIQQEAKIITQNHTWEHRAKTIKDLIVPFLP